MTRSTLITPPIVKTYTTKEWSQIGKLFTMLRFRRPAGSQTELDFIRKFVDPTGAVRDGFNNRILRIGTAPILWSCHTDTVHRSDGLQSIGCTHDKIMLSREEKLSTCLGADDTTGVWLMLEMIEAKVEGLYIFHREEECGSNGSKHIAKKTPELLKDIEYAVAFDRRGFDNIITFQCSSRCCSERFSESIAPKLPQGYKADNTGIFTDTANYTEIIPECTNLSVGYDHEHSTFENQSIGHALALRAKMVQFSCAGLVTARDPAKKEWKTYYNYRGGEDSAWGGVYGGGYDWKNSKYRGSYLDDEFEKGNNGVSTVSSSNPSMVDLVKEYPNEVADILEQWGLNASDIEEYIEKSFMSSGG